MATINEIQDQIINEFSVFDDWMDKYSLLIDMGNELSNLDAKYKTQNNLIEGCQSRVWLQADYYEGKVVFSGDSDAVIVKGIVSLLIRVLSGQNPDDILKADLYFIETIGLKEHLSPTRSNGLVSMIKQMKLYALAFNHASTALGNHASTALGNHASAALSNHASTALSNHASTLLSNHASTPLDNKA